MPLYPHFSQSMEVPTEEQAEVRTVLFAKNVGDSSRMFKGKFSARVIRNRRNSAEVSGSGARQA